MDLAIKVFEIGSSTSLNNYSKLIRFVLSTLPPFCDYIVKLTSMLVNFLCGRLINFIKPTSDI